MTYEDENHDLLIRIDERLKALDARVAKLERSFDDFRDYIYKSMSKNGWRERGIMAAMASIIVGFVELLRRLTGG